MILNRGRRLSRSRGRNIPNWSRRQSRRVLRNGTSARKNNAKSVASANRRRGGGDHPATVRGRGAGQESEHPRAIGPSAITITIGPGEAAGVPLDVEGSA